MRRRSSFQPNSLEVVGGVLQQRQHRFRFARHLYFPNDLACVIHNADARLLDRSAAPKIFSYPQAAGRLPHLSGKPDIDPASPNERDWTDFVAKVVGGFPEE